MATLALLPTLACAEVIAAAYPEPPRFAQPVVASSPGSVSLAVDFVIVLPIGADIGTILLGNSEIADATLTDGQMIVLKGVSRGLTNLIVLDTAGKRLAEIVVQVSDRKPGTVTVRRAMLTQSYSCAVGVCDNTASSGSVLPVAPPASN
ncbi:pilus assembly protein N-terminal domain-containing protein [Paracoccaceae bacterium Fryx2]|nr:pilus assembly protein N-terminal domain-containing protein [Paracoccaceae bacterium Fryx2]